jgi:hypothetical protein
MPRLRDVRVDLRLLGLLHPLLPHQTSATYAHRAALALLRSGHSPGTDLTVSLDDHPATANLDWETAPLDDGAQLDRHRVTEDGAEGIALALVAVAKGWQILRRLQRGESGDWLLRDSDNELFALEISGIDGDYNHRRLAQKIRQVSYATISINRFASVVAFGPPMAIVACVKS